MKKILLTMFALVVALAASAATAVETTIFHGKLGIDITGGKPDMKDATDATITVSKMDDDTYTFVLNKFSFGEMLIGDATVSGLTYEKKDGAVILSATDKEAPITNGGEIAEVIGGKVNMTLTATIKDGQMTADLSKIEVYLSGPDADPLIVCARFESTSSETGINTVVTSGKLSRVYDISSRELPALKKGLNVVKTEDGKTVKVIK